MSPLDTPVFGTAMGIGAGMTAAATPMFAFNIPRAAPVGGGGAGKVILILTPSCARKGFAERETHIFIYVYLYLFIYIKKKARVLNCM